MNEVRSSTKFYLHVLIESIPVLKENGPCLSSGVSEHELRRRPIEGDWVVTFFTFTLNIIVGLFLALVHSGLSFLRHV